MLQEAIVQDAVLQEISLPTKSHSHHSDTDTSTCPNCNNKKSGKYCSNCSAESIDHHDLSLKHFLHHSLHEFTHIEDSKILNTLKLLVFYPGKLTTEYLAGRKIRYISPVRMFLIGFALSLLVYTVIEKNFLYSVEFMIKVDPVGQIEQKVEQLLTKTNLSRPELYQQIDQNWRKYIHYYEVGFIVVISLLMKGLYFKRFLVEHIVFTLHFMAFMMLYAILRWPLYHFYGAVDVAKSLVFGLAIPIISWVYMSFALKQMYGQKWWLSITKAFVLVVVYQLYNAIVQSKTLQAAMDQI